jgi:hypothetical protein
MTKLLTCFAMIAALYGCASTLSPYAGCRTWDQQSGTPQLNSVSVLSPDLAKIIGVQDFSTSRTATGMAAVQATVYNCTDVDVVLLMRSRFSGDRGQSEGPSAWRTVHLAPRTSATYGETAANAQTARIAVDIYDVNRAQQQFAPGQSYSPAPQR